MPQDVPPTLPSPSAISPSTVPVDGTATWHAPVPVPSSEGSLQLPAVPPANMDHAPPEVAPLPRRLERLCKRPAYLKDYVCFIQGGRSVVSGALPDDGSVHPDWLQQAREFSRLRIG